MSYSGFFVRENIGQTVDGGQDPSQWSASPDIILCGTTAPPNTTDFTTPQGYATDYGNVVYMNQVNYVYLRALNATTSAATGRAWFYYTESDLCLWPSKWMSANILVDGIGINNQKIIATGGNQVCVSGPFLWTPPSFHQGHSGDDHYCLVSWMENPPLQDPPWTPTTNLPELFEFEDLLNFILDHPNMGWRNTVDISGHGPSWQKSTAITGARNGAQIYVGVEWKNLPSGKGGGTISYSIPGNADGMNPPTINTDPPIPISLPTSNSTVPLDWADGFSSTITISYTQGTVAPPKGAWIAALVILPTDQLKRETLERVRQLQPERLRQLKMVDALGHETGIEGEGVIVGSTQYRF